MAETGNPTHHGSRIADRVAKRAIYTMTYKGIKVSTIGNTEPLAFPQLRPTSTLGTAFLL